MARIASAYPRNPIRQPRGFFPGRPEHDYREMTCMKSQEQEKNPTATRLALLLIVIGALLAIDAYMDIHVIPRLWPLLILLLGTGLIAIFARGNARVPMFLAAGVYLSCFSFLALYCNFTSWGELSTLWPLFIGFLGISFLAIACFAERRYPILLTGFIFVSLGVTFLILLTHGLCDWWVTFVLAGVSILLAEKLK